MQKQKQLLKKKLPTLEVKRFNILIAAFFAFSFMESGGAIANELKDKALEQQIKQGLASEQIDESGGLLWQSLPFDSLEKHNHNHQESIQWKALDETFLNSDFLNSTIIWFQLPESSSPSSAISTVVWEPLGENNGKHITGGKSDPAPNKDALPQPPPLTATTEAEPEGLRWPNGQLMIPADQKFYSTAYGRGSQIQIGDTIYPNLGFNALQRQPKSWGNLALAAIDNSFQGIDSWANCDRGDFRSNCADGLLEGYVRLWNSDALSFDLQWTMHSLSGPGSPFSEILEREGGTSFGSGQSLGFRISKNITNTFGLSLGADRLIHLDKTTDLAKNLYLIGTKIFKLNQSMDSPILSVSLGLKSDTYNPDAILGTIQYPEAILGGEYPSIFAEIYDGENREQTEGRGYYPNVAGVTSPFVCAEQSIFAGKSLDAADSNCIKQVFIGPVASIGFAPWPWLGVYAIYEGNINLGLSVRPFKDIPWNISIQAIQPFTGINYRDDDYIRDISCRDQDLASCRTRVGIYTDLAF